MFSVLSATEDDFYAMPLPFAVYSWRKLGFLPIIFIPNGDTPKLNLARKYCEADFVTFDCADHKKPTYSQVIRLFGASVQRTWQLGYKVMITADSDMAVFSGFFKQLNDGQIHVVGNDLTPEDQYPMCYCGMPVAMWLRVMEINTKSAEECAAEIIEPIQSMNLRGDSWYLDQWLLKKMLEPYKDEIVFHPRSNGENQFATKRADRDGWHFNPEDILDAHLPRPLTDESNFEKVVDLFSIKYPEDDLSWMTSYYKEYLSI